MSGGGQVLVFLGLSLSSSWGNGHATGYRALLKALAARGHRVTFLERDVEWYAAHRDLREPGYCRLAFYADLDDLARRHAATLAAADAVIIGSYVPQGVAVARLALGRARGLVGFYDIDTPVTLAKLARGDEEYLSLGLIPAFDFYLSFAGGPALAQLRLYGARRVHAFPCMVDPDLYRPTGAAVAWDLGYLGTYSPDRQGALERLLCEPARCLPDRRFVVAGPQYPRDLAWPDNVTRIDHVPPPDHAGFYSRLGFALNLTRADMATAGYSPSVRLFEAAACGTPIISDRWDGLDDTFPVGRAVVVADESDDVVAALTGLASGRRRDLARCAADIVLSRHTGARRAVELEAVLAAARRERQ